jgi:acyl-CoA thioesterase FadM
MGIEIEFTKVKLFSGIIYKEVEQFEKIKMILQKKYSPIDFESQEIPFDMTNYYNKEMGNPLFRIFISFKDLVYPDQLPDIKIFTDQLEQKRVISGNRIINIDPGFLSQANVIIATTKNHYHRVPLQKGIYAHIEYIIKKKKLVSLEWTYPDFKKRNYLEFFTKLKELYKENLRKVYGVRS